MTSPPKRHKRRNIVGERVKQARLQSIPPLTQDQLSGKLASEGVQLDRVAIAKVESGLRCVFDFEARALASALRVDVKWLLHMEPTSSPRSRKTVATGKVRG